MTTKFLMAGNGVRKIVCFIAVLLVGLCLQQAARAQAAKPAAPFVSLGDGIYYQPGLPGPASVENQGRTGNIAFVEGKSGVLVFNSGVTYLQGQQAVAQILQTVKKPIRLLLLSHAYQDVLFGWRAFSELGVPVWMHRGTFRLMRTRCDGCLHTLNDMLGPSAMFRTGLVKPDRILDSGERTRVIGRDVEILDLGFSSGPNDLAMFDHASGTLFAGPLVFTDRMFEIRDGRLKGWLAALDKLQALPVKRVVPAYGKPGDATAITQTRRYLTDLSAKATELLKGRVGLSSVVEKGQLPRYSKLNGYEEAHGRNIHQMYLILEQNFFE